MICKFLVKIDVKQLKINFLSFDAYGKPCEEGLVEPITNVARPGTLVAFSMTIIRFSDQGTFIFKLILLIGAIMFLVSSFFIFSYSIYPAKKALWALTSSTFFIGMFCSIISSIIFVDLHYYLMTHHTM